MRVVRLVLSFVLILSSSPQLCSQQTSTSPTRDPQAISIASWSVATMGAPTRVSSGGVVATGTVTIPGLGSGPLPIILKSMSPRTLRSEIHMPKGLNALIVNDGRGAIKRPNGSVKWLQLYSTMALRAEFLPSFSLLSEYGDAQVSIRKLADAVVQGQPANVVELNLENYSGQLQQFVKAATRQRYFISKATGLVLALEYDNFAENDSNAKVATQVLYSDYRSISGLWVPFHQETYSDGQLSSTLILVSFALGSTVSAGDFALPQVSQ